MRIVLLNENEPQHDKTNRMSVHPAKTQISLGIRTLNLLVLSCRGSNVPEQGHFHRTRFCIQNINSLKQGVWYYRQISF